MMDDAFGWLQRFFLSLCDGEWEHHHGVKIETMSDPGWQIDVDLINTPYEHRTLSELEDRTSSLVWMRCSMEGGVFRALCGTKQLEECILILKDVVEGRRGKDQTPAADEPPSI